MAAAVIAPTARGALRRSTAPPSTSPGMHPGAGSRPCRTLPSRTLPARVAPQPSRAVFLRRRIVAGLLALLLLVGLAELAGLVIGGISAWRSAPAGGAVPEQVSDGRAPGATGVDGLPAPRYPSADYVVEPGDTLWSIAERLDPSGDPRPIVDRLAAQTGGASLRAGQRLSLEGIP